MTIARVQPERKALGIRQVAKSAIAGLLILSWLFVITLAVSPALHEHFHHHRAPNHNHSCAATLLEHGKVLVAGASPLLLIFVLAFLFCLPFMQPVKFSFPDLRLSFGRAPPHSLGLL